MGTLKKLWKYFLLFIVVFVITGFLTNGAMKYNYEDTSNYEIKCESPEIKVDEFKITYSNGYIKGKVTNNTGKHLPLKYLQVDFYNKDGMYLGTEYKELKYFNVDETINFEISYSYNNAGKAVLDITDEMTKKDKTNIVGTLFKDTDDEILKIALPIAGVFTVCAVLP